MPDFLKYYIKELNSKSERIKKEYVTTTGKEASKAARELKTAFDEYWITTDLPESTPSEFSVLAIDSSFRHIVTVNGGIFYVVRALALSKDKTYRKVVTDFDFTSDSMYEVMHILHRKMEWLEHKLAIEAIKNGFDGYILIDGSIYGRVMHILIESGYINDRAFMLKYFETLIELLRLSRDNRMPIIGISKESKTSFFREFLIGKVVEKLREEAGLSREKAENLLSLALDNKRRAIKEFEDIKHPVLREIMEELLARRPDFQLILSHARSAGYTTPLILGGSARWMRSYKKIALNPQEFIKSNFPISSRDKEFVEWARKIVENIPELPAVVSFHLLPAKNDTPMRIDIPAWFFGIDKRISEVRWPEEAEVDIGEVLRIISAGYSGLENYNIWLKAVDDAVKLKRDAFENLYLQKFEEIVGRSATPRGYRRVRFP